MLTCLRAPNARDHQCNADGSNQGQASDGCEPPKSDQAVPQTPAFTTLTGLAPERSAGVWRCLIDDLREALYRLIVIKVVRVRLTHGIDSLKR
jgi:hypothetical protein